MPAVDHVTIAWGRDYSDVPPVNGVALGGGEQTIEVDGRGYSRQLTRTRRVHCTF